MHPSIARMTGTCHYAQPLVEMGSCERFVGLKLVFSWSLLLSSLGLQTWATTPDFSFLFFWGKIFLAGFVLAIFLPQLPKCQDYRSVLLCLFFSPLLFYIPLQMPAQWKREDNLLVLFENNFDVIDLLEGSWTSPGVLGPQNYYPTEIVHTQIFTVGEGEIKNDGGGWIQLWYIVKTLVNVTMYP
jgi:hypothetical protein